MSMNNLQGFDAKAIDRLKIARKTKLLTQAKFAKILGVGQSSIAQIEAGYMVLNDKYIRLAVEHLGISEDWLRWGKGTMEGGPTQENTDKHTNRDTNTQTSDDPARRSSPDREDELSEKLVNALEKLNASKDAYIELQAENATLKERLAALERPPAGAEKKTS